VFEYSTRDFFECQNIVEACWFEGFSTQFCEVFECQKFRHAEFLMLELAFLCLGTQSVIFFGLNLASAATYLFKGDFLWSLAARIVMFLTVVWHLLFR